jgi:uncharacterized protein YcaQ
VETARDLGCVQLDPISVVEKSHRLVWFSRVGPFARTDLERVLYQDRHLFEYWAHCASLVLTEDYAIHRHLMRRFRGRGEDLSERTRAWVKQNDKLRRYLLREIRRHGPVPSRVLEEAGQDPVAWVSTGWTSGRNVSRMLDFLLMQGTILVAGRAGGQKLWDLAERVLPEWTPRERLPAREAERRAAAKSLRALGVATPRQIAQHFTRGRYPNLPRVLEELERKGRVARVAIKPPGQREPWPGTWYVHGDDLPLAEQLQNGAWQPRTTLLSPFDNLICDRQRTRLVFNFDFTMEIYVPKAKRRYGYYVLPILHGDRLIGRVDPQFDRARGRLLVNAVHAEPDAPATRVAGRAVRGAIEELASFLGAAAIDYDPARLPGPWRRDLSRS